MHGGAALPAPRNSGKRRWLFLGGMACLLLMGTLLVTIFYSDLIASTPEGLLLHTVEQGPLEMTIKQRGTLESANNVDIVCRVKSSSRSGSRNIFVRWVIEDGSKVRAGEKLAELDDSSFLDEKLVQQIELDQAEAAMIQAQEQYKIELSQAESDIAIAKNAITLACLDLEKYCGLPRNTVRNMTLDTIEEHDFSVHEPDKGEYRQLIEEVIGRLRLSESNLRIWEDRVAWTERMVKMGYVSPSQAEADRAKFEQAEAELNKVEREKEVLSEFTRDRTIAEFRSLVAEAMRALDRVVAQSRATEAQALSDLKTKERIYNQKVAEMEEIERQIENCTIRAPQDGMVVYYVERSRRGSEDGQVAAGMQVRDGQKLMQLPDLNQMQVSLKVHESVVTYLKADVYSQTGYSEGLSHLQAGMHNSPFSLLGELFTQPQLQKHAEDRFREFDNVKIANGQRATVKVDAIPKSQLKAHVKSVATVATQEWYAPEVKEFPTIVVIDEPINGLRPNMSAEVTIHVEDTIPDVLTIPIPAVIGGSEMGNIRLCYVMENGVPRERAIEIGRSNQQSVEVIDGLEPGERVILNPKKLVGDSAKTRDEVSSGKNDSKDKQKESSAPGKGKGGGPRS